MIREQRRHLAQGEPGVLRELGFWGWSQACKGVGLLVLAAACSSDATTRNENAGMMAEPGGQDPAATGNGDAPDPNVADPGTDPSPEDMSTTDLDGSEALDPDAITNVDPPVTPPTTPPTGSGGCGQSTMPVTGARTLDVAGQARTYILDVPSGYDGTRPYPIVFAFHGATTSGEFFRGRFYGNLLSTMADEALLVHPDALGNPTQWGNGDVPFFDALLAALEAELCVDEERVFATGHSSGGFFTNTLGCQRGDVLRAIAPVSAGGPFNFGGGNGGNACTGEVAVWIAHAENDETVLFQRGVDSRDRWLAANGCGETTAAVSPEPCQEYAGCAAGLPVRFCVYQDGHNWPDFAPEGIQSFFSSF